MPWWTRVQLRATRSLLDLHRSTTVPCCDKFLAIAEIYCQMLFLWELIFHSCIFLQSMTYRGNSNLHPSPSVFSVDSTAWVRDDEYHDILSRHRKAFLFNEANRFWIWMQYSDYMSHSFSPTVVLLAAVWLSLIFHIWFQIDLLFLGISLCAFFANYEVLPPIHFNYNL